MTADGEGVERAENYDIQIFVLVHQGDEVWRRNPFRLPSERTKSQLRVPEESRSPSTPLHTQVCGGYRSDVRGYRDRGGEKRAERRVSVFRAVIVNK